MRSWLDYFEPEIKLNINFRNFKEFSVFFGLLFTAKSAGRRAVPETLLKAHEFTRFDHTQIEIPVMVSFRILF